MINRFNYLGWKPDIPDQRDLTYSAPQNVLEQLSASTDLSPQMTFDIYDQGQLGSCTANAIGADIQFLLVKQQTYYQFKPSRLFIYYNERKIENTVGQDSGAMIRDGIKSVNKQGVCPETIWPYDITQFTIKPSDKCYKNASHHQALQYSRVDRDLNQMKGCLAEGYPFVIGFAVYTSFESQQVATTGIMPIPKQEEKMLGGHAVLVVGYNDDKQMFKVRNSWGASWGDKGYFYMPYGILTNENLSDDFWTVRLMEV